MKNHVSAITVGVADLARSRAFYADGLGWTPDQDGPHWVSFPLGDGSAMLGLFPREALAAETGGAVGAPTGVTLSYVVEAEERVDAVVAEAVAAGATVVKAPESQQWGGRMAYVADPDGVLWKIAGGGGPQPWNAE